MRSRNPARAERRRSMVQPRDDPFTLLFAELHALEQELAVLREELADVRVRVGEAEQRG